MSIFNNIINFFLFNNCPLCGEFNSDGDICSNCYSKFDFLAFSCIKCQQPMSVYSEEINICAKCSLLNLSFYNQMRSSLSYNQFLKSLVLRFKNHNEVYLASIFAKIIYLRSKDLISNDSLIVPVPLHDNRIYKRGYNQSSYLAKEYAKVAQIQYLDDLLFRVKDTNSQSGKTSKERVVNVHGAFTLNKKYNLKNKKIFVIDDVITTGATIFECARILQLASPKEVNLLCLGRRII